MENALEFGNELIDKELQLGLFDIIAKPIIKAFYNYWKNNEAQKGTLLQIKTTLDCGKQLAINHNGSNEYFDKIVDENFIDYLKGDQSFSQCKKKHKNFNRLKGIIKDTFISRLKESMIMLKVKDDVEDYDSLVRAAFKTREEAYETLSKQLDFTDECIKIIESDLSILKIPTGKNILIKTLRKGFDQTRKNLLENINNIYSKAHNN